MKYHHPISAERTHVPELEQWAINQKPKTSDWTDLKLYRYNNSDLYQWWGRHATGDTGQGGHTTYSVFFDPDGKPFIILPIAGHDEALGRDLDGGEAALAIGEHAFRAGVAWGLERAKQPGGDTNQALLDAERAWSDYEPPEDIKALS